MRRAAFVGLWAMVALAGPWVVAVPKAWAQDFADVATISATMGVQGNRVCIGDGTRGDIGCPTYAPRVTAAGDVSISGNLQANQFIGDGSGLTGVVASSADRITSGTTSFVVVSDTGYISLTQGGTNTGWFDPTRGLVTLGVSATGGISGTTGYFSGRVGIGTTVPSSTLHIHTGVGGGSPHIRFSRPDNANTFDVMLTGAVWSLRGNHNSGMPILMVSDGGARGVGINLSSFSAAPSSSLHVSGTTRITSWTAIGANVTATTALDVYGTVSATSVVAGSAGIGALVATNLSTTGVVSLSGVFSSGDITATGRTVTAQRFVGDGSGLTGVVASSADRITSGTTSFVVVSNTGFISLTQGGTNTGWFDPARGLVTLGVSATGVISASGLFSSADITATGRTVTAQRFVGDGSGLTNVTANTPTVLMSADSSVTLVDMGTSGSLVSFDFDGNRTATIGRSNDIFGSAYLTLESSGSGLSMGADANNPWIGTRTTHSLRFITANNARMWLTPAGNLGINVGNPQSLLDVAGNGRFHGWVAIASDTAATTALDVYGTISATGVSVTGIVSATRFVGQFAGDGSGLTGVTALPTDRISSTNNQSMVVATAGGTVSYTLNGVAGAAYQHPTLGYVGPGVSTTGPVSATLVVAARTLQALPSSASSDCDDASDDGKLRRNATTGRYQFCRWTP